MYPYFLLLARIFHIIIFSFSFLSFSLLLHFPSHSSPSLLLISNIIFGFLLSLSSFTRFPSAGFTLPHSSSLPFSRFSLPLFYYLSVFYNLTPSLLARWSCTFVLLFGIASICISFLLSSFRFILFERDSRVSCYRRRGWTRTDWWRLSSVARGCKKRGVANRTVVGASIVTVLNERPWQSVSFPTTGTRSTRQFYQFISILAKVWPTCSQRPFCFLNATRLNRQRVPRDHQRSYLLLLEPDVF